jgi:asparagine synthase (glutamine-hydrolysing)
MCGIAGALILEARGEPLSETFLASSLDVMRHRGPDGEGVWMSDDRRVGFAHRRLSIIDLSDAAAQPMSDAQGEIWLTYNGEIYNHAELRAELEGLGYRFRTDHCDTEVLIYAYKHWGIECVHRFRGMFAFGLWDSRSRQLWLVRDRIGIKPLYYAVRGGKLLFASEIKALLEDPAQPRQIDEEAFFHYLSFLATPAPNTLFKGICKLPGGSMLVASPGKGIREWRYWDALKASEPVAGSDEEIAEHLLEELRQSVHLRKVSDVPVGVFLSGGIDSSTIAALFSAGEAGPVKTFSLGYDGDYQSYKNELHYARDVARRVGAEHREITLTQRDLYEFLPRMVELQDEPIADPVCLPVHYLSRLAREHGVIVAQLGEGSDELFWGYPSWKRSLGLQRLDSRFSVPAPLKRLGLAALRAAGKEVSMPYDWLDRAARGVPIFWGGAEAFSAGAKQQFLSPRMRSRFDDRSSWEVIEPIYQRYLAETDRPSPLNWMSYLDLNFRLPELLLMRVDKMSMGASLEARVPFLDHKLVEFAMGIPEQVKSRSGVLKSVLKRAVRGVIPDAIIDRPKQGFGVPVREWLQSGLPDGLMDVVRDFLAETDLLETDRVIALFSDPRGASLSWPVLNLALWWDRFIRRKPASAPVRMQWVSSRVGTSAVR